MTAPRDPATCAALRDTLDRVGSKWALAIISSTRDAPVRFAALERSLDGISRRMLSLTLRELERDGLLERRVHPTTPPQVEYLATDMARELHDTVAHLSGWAVRHRDAVASARAEYDGSRP
ncbi:winged helix-turn-helix transcriptional regulator [Actinomycetospora aeridis]|uniref:Helix-turn-helix domain-containing protein n=1 Tax=Actinomycetospora aeridis TaxID=3129231 RepID=A0ABU8NEJ1_9PSEU